MGHGPRRLPDFRTEVERVAVDDTAWIEHD